MPPSLRGHVSVGARVVRSGGEGLYGRPRSSFPLKDVDPTTNTWSCIELVFSGAGATRQGKILPRVLSQARRKRPMLPTYRTKWKGRNTNDQAIHPMDSAAGSNCTNWGILSSLANGGYACSRACCHSSPFPDYNTSWPNAGLVLASLMMQTVYTLVRVRNNFLLEPLFRLNS